MSPFNNQTAAASKRPSPLMYQEDEDSYWGWKSFSNIPCLPGLTLSCGGNPPRERKCVMDLPYETLTLAQKAAAQRVLGVTDETSWESSLPRRVYGNSEYLVLNFQNVPWNYLSKDQQNEASSELDLDKSIWNNNLVPFHDHLWTIEGISLSEKEFSAVLSSLTKMARQPLSKADLAQFLLDLGRVLTPAQGVKICNVLMNSNCWEILEPPVNHNNLMLNPQQKCSVQSLVASFISDTDRLFYEISTAQLQIFWNDLNSGCTWGSTNDDDTDTRPKYATILKERYDKQLALRRCVGPLLTGAYNGPLPALPRSIAWTILNEWIGEDDPISPYSVQWQLFNESSLVDILPTMNAGGNIVSEDSFTTIAS